MGASKDAPVSDKAGKANPVRFHHPGISLSGGGIKNHLSEDATMATTPTQTHPSSRKSVDKSQRRYTVGYVPNQGDTSTPAINLSGKWLREVGFDTGRGLTARIAGDCIVLIPDNDDVQVLREELKEMKQAAKAVKERVLSSL
jgi:toxic protein SymE